NFVEARFVPLAESFGLTDYSVRLWAQNIADIYYQSTVGLDEPTGNPFYLFAYAAVAVFILLVACINYVNLATSQFISRGKEVGIRKTMGAARLQLMSQFLGEAIIYVFFSCFIAYLAAAVFLEYGLFESLFNNAMSWQVLLQADVLLALASLSLLVGLVAGIYPAFYLASISPKAALHSTRAGTGMQSGLLRQFLVLLQFTVAIAIVASTLIMAAQLRHLSGLSLGYAKENRLLVNIRGADTIEAFPALRNELLALPNVNDVSMTSSLPGSDLGFYGLNVETEAGNFEVRSASLMEVGNNFVEVLDMNLIQGRSLIDVSPAGAGQNLLVNEVFVEQMQWQSPIGKQISGFQEGTVVGVVADFNLESLHQPIGPVILRYDSADFDSASTEERASASRTLVIHLTDNSIDAVENVGAIVAGFDPVHPFEFEFLADRLDQLYASEQNITRLTAIFAGICLLICCLGLFGLAAFNAEQRTKEFGIRKVLGATGLQLFWLLVRNIFLLVGASSAIAAVITWLAMSRWLQSFAYVDGFNSLPIMVSIFLVLVVAVATVALQSAKTVRSNPVEALRYE
ncbi:MAG: FtsX-like permease family protein, partial [Pseudomonadales bacterium]|nr:FtsX-like permease family protein [Pseudomonadales bacterium]